MMPYSEALIRSQLTHIADAQLECITIVDEVDSTNTQLLAKARNGENRTCVLLAHEQSAGRGRHGKQWYSPRDGALYLSLLWHFDSSPLIKTGLPLAIGISLCQGLNQWGIDELGLKWPNDLLWQDKKLGGILVETYVDKQAISHGVIGIGINIELPENSDKHIQQPWIDLKTIYKKPINKNELISILLNHLVTTLILFEKEGLAPFQAQWKKYDRLYQQKVHIIGATEPWVGIARGIDNKGGLRIETQNGIAVHYSGEISVRAQ